VYGLFSQQITPPVETKHADTTLLCVMSSADQRLGRFGGGTYEQPYDYYRDCGHRRGYGDCLLYDGHPHHEHAREPAASNDDAACCASTSHTGSVYARTGHTCASDPGTSYSGSSNAISESRCPTLTTA
jgi:hypothetical protein